MRQRSLPTRRPQDRGASAIEYAGLIVLAALILGALVAIGIPGKVGGGVERAICTILHEQNCGKPAAAASPRSPGKAPSPTTPAGTVPRFGGGILHGLASIAVPPASVRDALPVRATSPPAKPRKKPQGGDKTTVHNQVVRDAQRRIEEVMGMYVTHGKVTIDCMPGGTAANCIPGGHKSGTGKDGRADVILRGYDKNTGKPVIYVWEVKPDSRNGRREAKLQLDRYVRQKQAQVGRSTEVRYGFDLPYTYPIVGKNGRKVEAFSEGDTNINSRGVRFYRDPQESSSPTPSQQATPQQTQSQPQQRPSSLVCNEQPPIALKAKKECITLPGLPQQPPRGQPKQPQQQPQKQPEAPEEPAPIAPEPDPVPVEEPVLVPSL